MILVGNMVEKMIKIYQIFVFWKKQYKTSSETRFHKNRQYRTDSRLCARHGSDVQFFDFFQLKNEILENP